MKSSRMSVAVGIVALIAAIAYNVLAEEPAINPARITTPQIVVYGTANDSTFAGGVTIAGTAGLGAVTASSVTASGLAKSYSYAVDVGPSATQVYLTQMGTNNAAGGTVQTNVFPITFIDTPVVFIRNYGLNLPATNSISISTNKFEVTAGATPGEWLARGRIK